MDNINGKWTLYCMNEYYWSMCFFFFFFFWVGGRYTVYILFGVYVLEGVIKFFIL